jgi:hypothetical protein
LEKVFERKQSLAQEKGAFTALTTQQLEEAARKEANHVRALNNARLGQSERNSVRTSGFDPNTGLPMPGGKA